MVRKVYKSGYQIIVDPPLKPQLEYTTSRYCRFGFDGDICWIKDMYKDEYIFKDIYSNMAASDGFVMQSKEATEEYLLSFIANSSGDSSNTFILFQDVFTGTIIDETINWNKTIEGGSSVTITQNEQIDLFASGTANDTSFASNLQGQNSYNTSDFKAVIFDLQDTYISVQNTNFYGVGISTDLPLTDNINRVAIQNNAGFSSKIKPTVQLGSVNIYNDDFILDISTFTTFQIVVNPTTVDFYYWDESWQLIVSVVATVTGNFYPFMTMSDRTISNATTISVDNFYLLTEQITTQYPI